MDKKDGAQPVTQEESDAIASVYEKVLTSMRQNKLSSTHHYHIWDSLKAYFQSREPKSAHLHYMTIPNNWGSHPIITSKEQTK